MDAIQNSDASIVSVSATYVLIKQVITANNLIINPVVNFDNQLVPGSFLSSAFTAFDVKAKLNRTANLLDDGQGKVMLVWYDGNIQRSLGQFGTINYGTGVIRLSGLEPVNVPNNFITLNATVVGQDVMAAPTQILVIDSSSVFVTATKVA